MSNLSFEYAKALFELSDNTKDKKDIFELLKSSLDIFLDDEIYHFMSSPTISKDDKKKVIEKSYPKGLFRNFLYVLIDNSRMTELKEIKDDYESLLLDYLNKMNVLVYSKERLQDTYLSKLKEELEKKFKKELVLTNLIDESIKAGVRIEYDSKVLDLSVNKRLENLKKELKG